MQVRRTKQRTDVGPYLKGVIAAFDARSIENFAVRSKVWTRQIRAAGGDITGVCSGTCRLRTQACPAHQVFEVVQDTSQATHLVTGVQPSRPSLAAGCTSNTQLVRDSWLVQSLAEQALLPALDFAVDTNPAVSELPGITPNTRSCLAELAEKGHCRRCYSISCCFSRNNFCTQMSLLLCKSAEVMMVACADYRPHAPDSAAWPSSPQLVASSVSSHWAQAGQNTEQFLVQSMCKSSQKSFCSAKFLHHATARSSRLGGGSGVPVETEAHEASSSLKRFARWLGSWSPALDAVQNQNEIVLQVRLAKRNA